MQEIEVSITLKGLDVGTLIRLLAATNGGELVATRPVKVIDAESSETGDDSTADITKGKKTRGPYKKAKKEPEPVEDDEEESESDEAEEGKDESEDEDEEEKTPKKSKKDSAIKLDDVLDAFGDYTKEHGRDKAATVLKKFDVKVIRKAPEELWPKLLKALKV